MNLHYVKLISVLVNDTVSIKMMEAFFKLSLGRLNTQHYLRKIAN